MDVQKCSKCGMEKDISLFRKINNRKRRKTYFSSKCIVCERNFYKSHYELNKISILETKKTNYNNGIKEDPDKKKSRAQRYYKKNKESIREKQKDYIKQRRKTDVSFRLNAAVSKSIYRTIALNGFSKNGKSTFKYLPYTKKELREHLEKQFESWMTWENYGIYDSKIWDDNDSNTWTWNIDHIIPQSDLSYTSMTDDNFKKCWALSNLRPYSAKQNWLDGMGRTRHFNKVK